MRKLMILGLILLVFMTGCTVDFGDGISFSTRASKYEFNDYETFLSHIEDLDNDYTYADVKKDMKVTKFDTIIADAVFEEVTVIAENRKDVEIHYFAIFEEKEKDYPIFDHSGDDFKFKVSWDNYNGAATGVMIIRIPDDYDKDILIDIVSGDVEAKELTADKASIETVSGEVNLGRVESKSLKVDTTSGDIDIETVDAKELNLDSTSGEIKLNGGKVPYLLAETTSGDIDLRGEFEILDLDSVSGSITIQFDEQEGDIKISSTSGDVTIIGLVNAKVDLDTTSGDISCNQSIEKITSMDDDHMIAEIGRGKYDMEIDTVSGEITIQ